MNNEINKLKRELIEEKNKNKKFQDTIKNLNNTINHLKEKKIINGEKKGKLFFIIIIVFIILISLKFLKSKEFFSFSRDL